MTKPLTMIDGIMFSIAVILVLRGVIVRAVLMYYAKFVDQLSTKLVRA